MITSRLPVSQFRGRGGFTPNAHYGRPETVVIVPEPVDPAEQAYRDGYQDGAAAARAETDAALAEERAGRAAIELAFARCDADAAQALRERLRATVLALCEEAVLPLALDQDGLARRVEAAASLLKRKQDERVIRLHPQDVELVRGKIDPELALVADPSVERGALRIETADGGIEDGPEQWRRALAEAFSAC